jgi:NAD(P)-dependent dehydrogenase (short-subunit alcohol dehydrogenase family)
MYNYLDSPFSLSGKTIFVTGASSGIGRSVAFECSKAGAKLIITGRDEDRLDETFKNLSGKDHLKIIADITDHRRLKTVVEGLPLLNGVVHCAGVARPMPFVYTDENVVNEVIGTNFTGPLTLTRLMLKLKKLDRNASIVFISSVSGTIVSSPGGSVYSASKGAINGLIKGMALDLAPKGIRVNAVAPGMIETDIYAGSSISQHQLQEDKKRYPLKRYGKPEEVAYSVIYLLSDASAWVTGSSLVIDGGFTLL